MGWDGKEDMPKRREGGRKEGKWGRSGRLHMVRRTGQLLDHWRAYFAADQSGRKNRKLSGRFSIPVPREHPLYSPSFFVSLRSPMSQTRTRTRTPKYTRTRNNKIYIYTYMYTRNASAFHAPHFRLSQDPRISTRFRIFDKIQPVLRIPVSILLFYFLFFFFIIIISSSFLLSNWRSSNCLNKKKNKSKAEFMSHPLVYRSIRFENSNEEESC